MKNSLSRQILIILALCLLIPVVSAVAPSDIIFEYENATDLTIHDFDLRPHFYVIDNDSTSLNCSVYITYISSSGTLREDDLLDTVSATNNTQTNFDADLAAAFSDRAGLYINWTINCTDGADTYAEDFNGMYVHLFYEYTASDITHAIIDAVAMASIAFTKMVGAFVLGLIFIWGWKAFKSGRYK